MIKGLEALKHIYLTATDRTNALCVMDYETIQKELKALEIIKEKRVWVYALLGMTYKEYNDYCQYVWCIPELTKEEYELLKEVLKDE